ncbi:uncharacterized protein LOC111632868 [Centruroides sculpturatus]|uniref:uncharacterized protein LOC111632868 n=1 Tax=Centruroides sculpturatus TaxID=218467 RepID=UPI000C6D28F1|nr:uncharacterized protein LOC111632868 [Centruroides sculpturatus]
MIRIFALAFVFHHATALMDPTEFIEKIKPKCFDDAMPRKPSSGLTLGNFIYLVEKFEEKHPERNIETNIKTLLNEFSCEGLKYPLQKTGDTYYGKRETYAEERKDILDVFVKDDDIAKLEEDDFTDDEICNLFFSLSHTVYETEIKPRPERKPDKQTNTTDEIPIPNEQDQQEPVRVNVEDGVVSFGGDETRAISLSDVLFGILGALREEEKKINEFFPPHNRNPEFDDKVFQSSFLFSLSAKTAESVFHLPENIQPSAGYWISTDCSKNYILKTNTEMFTYATLIGSVDGYLMGKKLLGDKSRLPKLSQLLRMYYSKQGFSSFLSKLPLSFCQRGSEMEDETFKSELKSQVYNYVLYYNLKKKMHTTEITKQKTEASMAKFRNEIPKALAQVNVERKKCGKINEEVCETPSNVVVVLDKRNHFDTQLHTIAKLINNNGISENTFRVFVNAEDDIKIDMRKITDTVDANRIIASCALDEYNKDNDAGLLEENLVLQAINRTLMNIELELISLPGMPSKVVFYYNYGLVLENNAQLLRKIDDARRELINKHRGAEIYAIGENKEYLQKFVPSLNVIDSRNDNLLETLEQKICSAPAEFQYLECTVRSKMDQDFLLHINPNGVQYWQMQPKYFYKSFGYKLRFKPENGNIRVCFKRMKQFSKSDEGCQATTETKREIEFVNRDPCKGFDAVTCSPFYFGIYGVDDTSLTECTTGKQFYSN